MVLRSLRVRLKMVQVVVCSSRFGGQFYKPQLAPAHPHSHLIPEDSSNWAIGGLDQDSVPTSISHGGASLAIHCFTW